MKKFLIIGSIAGVVLIALGVAGLAFAQTQPPPTPFGGAQGNWGMMGQYRMGAMMGRFQQAAPGYGMMRGMWFRGATGAPGQPGPMHPFMIAALAEKLGLTAEELQAKIDGGETPYVVAKSQGLSDEDIKNLFEQAHDTALQQAVAAGLLTQEQADWMDQHMEQRLGRPGGFGWRGGGHCFGGQFTQP